MPLRRKGGTKKRRRSGNIIAEGNEGRGREERERDREVENKESNLGQRKHERTRKLKDKEVKDKGGMEGETSRWKIRREERKEGRPKGHINLLDMYQALSVLLLSRIYE